MATATLAATLNTPISAAPALSFWMPVVCEGTTSRAGEMGLYWLLFVEVKTEFWIGSNYLGSSGRPITITALDPGSPRPALHCRGGFYVRSRLRF